MTVKRTAEGCTVTTEIEVTESGAIIEHVTLECVLELAQPIREKIWYTKGD